jgi:predicted dehydrogenase
MKKAVVIGLGDISKVHLNIIETLPDVTLCGVCDLDEKTKTRAPDGVSFYRDYKDMIKQEKPDCVHICLPHYMHVPVAMYAVESECNVFCEKPVALDIQQAMDFALFEQEHPNQKICICLQNRYNTTVVKLVEELSEAKYGKIVGLSGIVPWARSREYYQSKPWRGRLQTAGGGCMINQAVHTLDLLYYIGGRIKSIHGVTSQLLDYEIEVEDTVVAHFDYENGAKGMFFATVANYTDEKVEIRVETERAKYVIRDGELFRVVNGKSIFLCRDEEEIQGGKFYYGAGHQKIIEQFYNQLETDGKNYVHVRDAVMSIQLIDTIHTSSKLGKKISLLC